MKKEKSNFNVSLVGPPNSGKTTIFNKLCGKKHKTSNYPGATVEYSASLLKDSKKSNIIVIDTPGIISITPASADEQITIDCLFNNPEFGKPNLIVITADSTQLSRHLALIIQILKTGANVVVALTMTDLLKNCGYEINVKKLSELINCKVIKINGNSGEGCTELSNLILSIYNNEKEAIDINPVSFDKDDLMEIFIKADTISNQILDKSFLSKESLQSTSSKLHILNQDATSNLPNEQSIKIDRIILHKYWGIVIFVLIMTFFFSSIFWIASPFMDLIDISFDLLSKKSGEMLGNNWISELISDGIIKGLGSVLVFLPQIIILFFILGILEDSGYLARGAVIIDRPLSKLGLNGRSFVPMLSGFACAIPAIMASRTIPGKRERIITIFIIPLLSCSARLPVYALLISYLLPRKYFLSGLLLLGIYIFSVIVSLTVGNIINRFGVKNLLSDRNSSFIMELPKYRLPRFRDILKNTLNNANQYLKKAGPVILVFSVILWALVSLPTDDNNTGNKILNSYAAKAGKIIEPAVSPLGVDWKVGLSLISTLAAREVFVSSLALILNTEVQDDYVGLRNAMENAVNDRTGEKLFTVSTTSGIIVFFIFALQCISTLAITKKETNSWVIPSIQIILYFLLAYIFSFLTVHTLRLIGYS